MNEKYAGEETGSYWGTKVEYLTEQGRADYKLTTKNGKLYDNKGNLFDTGNSSSAFSEGKAIFVMDENGNIFASKTHDVGKFHHSSFMSGQPVASAGELTAKSGEITEMSNGSGHYWPSQEFNSQTIEQLKLEGVDTKSIKITDF